MGMILVNRLIDYGYQSCPHTHGDDPQVELEEKNYIELVPTRMGMIPLKETGQIKTATCPHTHGDDPIPPWRYAEHISLSPHAWG